MWGKNQTREKNFYLFHHVNDNTKLSPCYVCMVDQWMIGKSASNDLDYPRSLYKCHTGRFTRPQAQNRHLHRLRITISADDCH